MIRTALLALSCLLVAASATSKPEPPGPGEVVVPLERYEDLLKAYWQDPDDPPDEVLVAPIDVALQDLRVVLTVKGERAEVRSTLTVRVLTDDWVNVRLLPAGTALASVTVDGAEDALVEEDGWLVLHLRGKGAHSLALSYQVGVDALRGGHRLDLPVPRAASGSLDATLPGIGWDAHVLPSAGIESRGEGGSTRVGAALPRTGRVLLLWGVREAGRAVFLRASYELEVVGEGVFAEAEFLVEIASDEAREVAVLPSSYALRAATVDGEPARMVLSGDSHAVTLQGHGERVVRLSFALVVDRHEGQPAVDLSVPAVPISAFRIDVPGKRTVGVEPEVPLIVEGDEQHTSIQAWVPRTEHVRFSWTDSRPVPEQDVRMNAESYWLVSAERAGLRVSGRYRFDVISGKAGRLLFKMPDEVVIYEVSGEGVADWRTSRDEETGERTLSVYLDRPRHGEYELQVAYDSLLSPEEIAAEEGVAVPLVVPMPVHRLQGVVLLLAGEELEFEPLDPRGFSTLGEESLPPELRAALPAKLAHGLKSVGELPSLTVRLREPQREPARFDVRLDLLHSLEEGRLRAEAVADVIIKSGRLRELIFEVGADWSVLDVVAPSLLRFDSVETSGGRVVTALFTEELEGVVRASLTLERLLRPEERRVELSPVAVRGADVQRGHLALESSAAVEVDGIAGDGVQRVSVEDLPRALSSATRHPILLANEYTRMPYELALQLTRHQPLPPQEARLLSAVIVTTVEEHGNVVTTAEYRLENRSRQFLRLELPAGSKPWHVTVSGERVRSARDGEGRVIVPLPRADGPVTVSIEYARSLPPLGSLGRFRLQAPRADLFTRELSWRVELPADRKWSALRSSFGAGEQLEGSTVQLQRELVAAGEEPQWMSLRHRRQSAVRQLDMVAGLLGVGLAGLLLVAQSGRSSSLLRLIALAVAAAVIAVGLIFGANPWALLLPVWLLLVVQVAILGRRRREAPAV